MGSNVLKCIIFLFMNRKEILNNSEYHIKKIDIIRIYNKIIKLLT